MQRLALDWLRYTYRGYHNVQDVVPAGDHYVAVRRTRPARYYDDAVELQCGAAVHWSDSAAQGVMVNFSGSALSAIYDADGADAIYALLCHAYRSGARVTRLDVALDVLGVNATVQDIVADVEAGRARVRGRSRTRIVGSGDARGDTYYIGSRSSDWFVRVYDKAARQGVDVPGGWVRVEVELKGDTVRAVVSQLVSCGLSALSEIVRSALDCSVLWYAEALAAAGPSDDISVVVDRDTDRMRWYRDAVLPALRRDLVTDSGWLRFALLAVLDDLADEQHGDAGVRYVISRDRRSRAAFQVLSDEYQLSSGLFRAAFQLTERYILWRLVEALGYVWQGGAYVKRP